MMIEEFLIAFFLTDLGSQWIDNLYSIPNVPLSFPDEIESRQKFRKPILFIAMISAVELLPNLDSILAMFFLTLITLTDFEQQVILDRMTIPFAMIGVIRIFYFQLDWLDYFLAAGIGGLIFLILAFLTHGAIGGGDIKLIAILGIWFGSEILSLIVPFGIILAGISAGIMLLTGLKSRKDYFAYAPYFTIMAIYFLIHGI